MESVKTTGCHLFDTKGHTDRNVGLEPYGGRKQEKDVN